MLKAFIEQIFQILKIFNGYKKNTINSCTIGFLESENGDIYGNLKKRNIIIRK